MDLSGKKPPRYGNIQFEIDKEPVSLQAKSHRKKALKKYISQKLKDARYFLTGDVKIDIEWAVHEKKRYETDASADIDNIIKPLLDSLCGRTGILIDDNQVQCVTCNWVNSYQYESGHISISVKYMDGEFISKNGLIFISVEENLCLPFNDQNPLEVQKIIIENWIKMFKDKNKLLSQGEDYYDVKSVTPIQRVFHKSRIDGFDIVKINDKLEQLKS